MTNRDDDDDLQNYGGSTDRRNKSTGDWISKESAPDPQNTPPEKQQGDDEDD